MDDAAHSSNSRPMSEYAYFYNDNAGYGSHEVHRFYQQRHSPQYSMTAPSIPSSQYPPPFERYTDYDEEEEKGEKDSSEGDWRMEEDERRDGMHQEAQFPARSTSRYYQDSMPKRPLIHHVRNDWRTDPRYGQSSPSPPPDYDNFDCLQIICAKRVRRIVGLFLISSVAFWIAWFSWLNPKINEHFLLKTSLDYRQNSKSGWFGTNVRPNFQDMIQLKTLDESLLPAGNKHKDGKKKRLIIIGDIHGCKDECTYGSPPPSPHQPPPLIIPPYSYIPPLQTLLPRPHRPPDPNRRPHLQRPLLPRRRLSRPLPQRLLRARQSRRPRPPRPSRPPRPAPHLLPRYPHPGTHKLHAAPLPPHRRRRQRLPPRRRHRRLPRRLLLRKGNRLSGLLPRNPTHRTPRLSGRRQRRPRGPRAGCRPRSAGSLRGDDDAQYRSRYACAESGRRRRGAVDEAVE